jgi:hypothetical protein
LGGGGGDLTIANKVWSSIGILVIWHDGTV